MSWPDHSRECGCPDLWVYAILFIVGLFLGFCIGAAFNGGGERDKAATQPVALEDRR